MPPKFADDMAIAFQQENPKRPGGKAHERYERYKAAATVGEAIGLGALRPDIASDMKAGYCHTVQEGLGGPAAAPQAPKAMGQIRAGPPVASPQAAKRRAVAAPGAACPAAALPAAAAAPPAVAPPVAAPPVAAPPCAAMVAPALSVEAGAPPAAPPPSAATSAAAGAALGVVPSSSSSSSRAAHAEVDLSFAKLDGKPLKFVKRAMGEARRLLSPQGLADAASSGYKFELLDRDNLAKWKVGLSDLNVDGNLAKDLAKHKLPSQIDLEIALPDGFPLEPPFVRVLYPQLSSGFVFSRGGICFEPLTAKGWAPSMTLPALAIAIKGIMDYGDVRVSGVGDKTLRVIAQYTEAGARKDHAVIVSAHNDGESRTYGGKYKS